MYLSSFFTPIKLSGLNASAGSLETRHKDKLMIGSAGLWGIPFHRGPGEGNNLVCLEEGGVSLEFEPLAARYLVFAHTFEKEAQLPGEDGIIRNYKGIPEMGAEICICTVVFADGERIAFPIRSRYEIGAMSFGWGSKAAAAEPDSRYKAIATATEDYYAGRMPAMEWGNSQTRVDGDQDRPVRWLYAWENPRPEAEIKAIEIAHTAGRYYLLGVTAAHVAGHPLRYGRRQKTALKIDNGKIDIDLGQIISVLPRPSYDNAEWETGYNNKQPSIPEGEYIVEYCAHEDAVMYVGERQTPLPVRELNKNEIIQILPAEKYVTLRVLGPDGKLAPVKVHAHGAGGEYLPPRNRHRIPNPYWFEDYSVDFVHGPHWCAYIDGEAEYLLPLGEVYFEVSKGFEIKPVRKKIIVGPGTDEIVIKLERVLDWRGKGWVTADTHVHFLSPHSALLEGEAEGVNVVNLLASQWGELFTNIGDFDGRSVLISDGGASAETNAEANDKISAGANAGAGDGANVGKNFSASKSAITSGGGGSKGEYMVRVGTENRQQLLGHISLLGYEGAMIQPLTTAGPDEAAIGDPVETTLAQWAAQCRAQKGVNILPHFPNPRLEGASAIVSELIDGVEMTSWGDLYSGISPYSLSDWYRYLNCGYHVAAVGGTDKMSANTAVGTVRTYAQINGPFTFDAWKEAVGTGRTFVTYGALADIKVEGTGAGGRIDVHTKSDGGANGCKATLQVEWSAASATIPVTAVELVVGGETADVKRFDGALGVRDGFFQAKIRESTWIAIRVRGHQPDKPEIITAHTSAVMVYVDGARPMSAPDAVTIIEQIEGATAYIKTIGTRAQEKQYKAALAALTASHRALHNRMHEMGHYHKHTVLDDHHKGDR